MAEVEIAAQAYVKMQLHAAKYPCRAVNGLLLADKVPEVPGGECLLLTDCVPLFHNSLALTVMLEVALNQVDLWSAANNQVIAGYYQANNHVRDTSLNSVAVKIADRVAEHVRGAVLIMLDNTKLSSDYSGPAVIVHDRQDGKWTPKDKNLVMWRDWTGTRSVVSELMEDRAYGRLVDFDEHLDDIRRDWSNGHINERIGALSPTANGSA
uniref:ER membrane protein complex subunit 9-like n=1 Tax=Pristiophorus japonicus TaxID=55135 RepID=UPI00398F7757